MNRQQKPTAPPAATPRRLGWFDRLSAAVARFASSRWGFGMAVSVVTLWAVLGPILHYSAAWQLTINTGTTIVTFLMVFLVQGSQDRGTRAIQLKLDELILAKGGARNSLVAVEELCEEDLIELQKRISAVARAFPGTDARSAHPVDPPEGTS